MKVINTAMYWYNFTGECINKSIILKWGFGQQRVQDQADVTGDNLIRRKLKGTEHHYNKRTFIITTNKNTFQCAFPCSHGVQF
jgi:hypothetical protein